MKKAYLVRTSDNGTQCTGTFKILDEFGNEIFSCLTLERPWLDNQKGISCIPTGKYIVQWGHMNSVNKDHYQVFNVTSRTAIFIHGGNRFADSHGCILLGYSSADIDGDGQIDITNSGNAIKDFESLMCKNYFELEIVNGFPI